MLLSRLYKLDGLWLSNPYISVNREMFVVSILWLWDDNKTTVTARVNIYAIDFKGQSLVHVPLPFSHLQA